MTAPRPQPPTWQPWRAPHAPTGTRRRALQQATAAALATLLGASHAADAPEARPALPTELVDTLPGAQALGSARMRFLGLDIYEARLWVGSDFEPAAYARYPLALELRYARSLSGRLIAERSLQEMRRQGRIAPEREPGWLQAMVQAFPDVAAGDRITGLHSPGVGARFWFNGQSRPAVRDADFSRMFFGIWLSEATSAPQLRSHLLGQKPT